MPPGHRHDAEPLRRTRGDAGFSFIEVLIVMGIIITLAGLGTVVYGIWNRQKPEKDTRDRMQKLVAVIGSWERKFDRLPPSDPTKLQKYAGGPRGIKKVPNNDNLGIESVFQAIYWDSFGVDPQLSGEALGNTDGDELTAAVTSQGQTLFEVVDGWGNPLVYFVFTDYAKYAESPPTYVTVDGVTVTPRPWKYDDESRGFAEPRRFQLYSMGPDGEPNTDDDVKYWK